ncbi:BamA/TamA family outer membrane protein [uncultured Ferrimonas sp.]|uniref:BamA/TamA family outer membrane protein n=1 Tax=uncultured Ferrimonas sp. TaxID=432640 RepID=UPI00260BB694|nr:BamA/TamA family outer membrane protein [uncultured Ferrimonas sp.]
MNGSKIAVWLIGLLAFSVGAQEAPEPPPSRTAVLPFIYKTSGLGWFAGGAVSVQGLGQSQGQMVGVGLYSTNNSFLSYQGAYNYQLAQDSRWYFDLTWLEAKFTESQTFISGVDGVAADAGQHDSAEDQFVYGEERMRELELTARYILPFGAGRADHQPQFSLHNGLPLYAVAPQSLPQPLSSVQLKLFHKDHQLNDAVSGNASDEATSLSQIEAKTAGMSISVDYDARDFAPSPSRGYWLRGQVTRDWGNDHRASYTKWEGQYSHYLDLGANGWMQQQTLVLSAYLADLPTWDANQRGEIPWYAAASVGGFDRLRGFASNRFHDRSALFYGAEYRMVPQFQPQGKIPVLNWYQLPWYQLAAFVEAGRVHDEFDLRELHRTMNISYGVGVRALAERVLVRGDLAFSEEESQIRLIVNQAF